MKIEKISDTQIKFYLTKEDLEERNLKITELAMGSEKAQMLFRDIMEQAMEECGFEASNGALMIEAVPASNESIMIIVSKVNDDEETDRGFNLTPDSRDKRRYVKSPLPQVVESVEEKDDDRLTVFSFKNLDDVTNASSRLNEKYKGSNILYKYQDEYYLVAQNDNDEDNILIDEMESILSEYGQKHISNLISKYYLAEHGEIIIKKDAVKVLASL